MEAKFTTCGSQRIMDFCQKFGIKYKRCGKVIGASNKEKLPCLDTLATRGIKSGLNVRKISKEELQEREPYVEMALLLYTCSEPVSLFAFNAPSPAATASRKIGDTIANYVMEYQSTGIWIAS